ncbi:MAG: hypothetical protein AAFP86_15955, partial [Planctomycetota bacterium]
TWMGRSWRHTVTPVALSSQDRPIQVQTAVRYPVRAGVLGGALYFVERRPDLTHWAHKLDASGAPIYSTGGVFSGPNSFEPIFAVAENGAVVVGRTGTTTFIDPAGNVVAELAGLSYRRVEATPSGGAIGLQTPTVDAFDAAGNLVWTRSGLTNAVDIEPTPDGGVRVFRLSGTPAGRVTLTELGPAGQFRGNSDLTLTDIRPYSVAPGRVGLDGSQLCALSYDTLSGANDFATVVGLAPDSVDLVSVCDAAAPNSTGSTGRITMRGDGVAAYDDVVLFADRLPPGQTTLFLSSRQLAPTPLLQLGQGTLCLGGTVNRFIRPGEFRPANRLGETWLRLVLPNTPEGSVTTPVLAGETWHYQAWHPDVVGGAQTTNLTNAVAVTYR